MDVILSAMYIVTLSDEELARFGADFDCTVKNKIYPQPTSLLSAAMLFHVLLGHGVASDDGYMVYRWDGPGMTNISYAYHHTFCAEEQGFITWLLAALQHWANEYHLNLGPPPTMDKDTECKTLRLPASAFRSILLWAEEKGAVRNILRGEPFNKDVSPEIAQAIVLFNEASEKSLAEAKTLLRFSKLTDVSREDYRIVIA